MEPRFKAESSLIYGFADFKWVFNLGSTSDPLSTRGAASPSISVLSSERIKIKMPSSVSLTRLSTKVGKIWHCMIESIPNVNSAMLSIE